MEQTPARHHRLLLSHLQAVAEGRIRRLMFLLPPGHAKSTYASVLFPPWFFQEPNQDVIAASHASELAEKFSQRVQSYIRRYGTTGEGVLDYRLDSENVKEWRTDNGGNYRAAGVGGSISGRRADLAIIDDPVRGAQDAESETVRETTWQWYEAELYTRLKPGGRIILIMTRWHPDDLGGRLLDRMAAGGDQWTVVKLPAIAEVNDPLGRAPGQALWPEWQDEIALLGGVRPPSPDHPLGEVVAGVRTSVGEYVWGSLYQQDPRPRGASFFDIAHLLGPDEQPVAMPKHCDLTFAVIDTAIKSGTQHNSTAVTWYSYDRLIKPTCTLILDWDIVQIEGAAQEAWLPSVFARGEELAKRCGARYGFAGAMIEDKATGTVLLQQAANLQRRGLYCPAFPIDSKLTAMGKDERAIAASPYVIGQGIKITDEAYHKTKVHKGRSANHLLQQVGNFRLGSKETDGLDLLDTFCYGVTLTHGNNAGLRKGI